MNFKNILEQTECRKESVKMELELEKRKEERYERVFDGKSIHEETTEIIVSDQSPDVARIIKGSVNAFLKDKNAREGKVDISGNIKGVVLYVAEGEKNIRRLNVSVPFAYVADCPGTSTDSSVVASVCVRSVDVREINPRKISVKVSLEIHISVYKYGEISLCNDVKKKADYGICTRIGKMSAYRPVRIANKTFVISDDIELTSSESDMCELLTSDIALMVTDTKVIGNKAIIKGNAGINYLYTLSDDTIECGSYELPFSQIIDVEGMNTEDSLKIDLSVAGFELEPQYDAAGKARYMTVNATSEASVFVFSNDEQEMIDDVYSTKYPIEVKKEKNAEIKLCEKFEKRVSVSDVIGTGMNIKRLLDLEIKAGNPVRRSEENGEVLVSDAIVTVMYLADDDSVYSAMRRMAAVCPLALKSGRDYESMVTIGTKNFSISGGNEVNVRFFADFDITETEQISVVSISEISVDAEHSMEMKDRPGVVVKRLMSDCDVWSLAKEHFTTEEEIKLANGIFDETELQAGRLVLIPQKR